ncbi:E3 ubiquitin- protein ligase upl1 [Datura stramonium]|uniref:E3 ubiquitin- protein ligase upl1 n=1 Tax=Datura stramonium TaxID=4076 RepID=A0ABS8SB32_DATST|nr:E3 ubiquitin- protein ligase upl1 [Datura stramonium]
MGVEREFLSVIRCSSEGFNRRSRHGLARIRGGRTSRHLESLQADSEAAPPVISKFSFKETGTALAKVFLEALGFSGYPEAAALDIPPSVKCRYLGKSVVVTLPYSVLTSGIVPENGDEENKLSHSSWLLGTLQSYCRCLNILSIRAVVSNLEHPKRSSLFSRLLSSQVLDVILPIWNHSRWSSSSANPRAIAPPPDEATISTIVEMGFSRARAEEALRRVETNSVEMAMEWLFSHAEDPAQEEDELARALALSLGNSSEASKADNVDRSVEVLSKNKQTKPPPVEDVLAATIKLFRNTDSMAFPRIYLDAGALCMIAHTLALLLSEDENIRGTRQRMMLFLYSEEVNTSPQDDESSIGFEKVFGKPTGYLSTEDSRRSCYFPGYDTLASAIVRHLLEDPQTLQTAMEMEDTADPSGSRHAGAVCQLELSGREIYNCLIKRERQEKEKGKTSVEFGASNECVRISENKAHDGSGKCSKSHKKIPANISQVIDHLLEIVAAFPTQGLVEDCVGNACAMEVDEPIVKARGNQG